MLHSLQDTLAERILTVEEYLGLINDLIAPLRVFVAGEVSDLKILPQWVFFALKDEESGALLRCGLHAQQYRRMGVNIEEGMMVKVEGYGKLAAKSGNFGFWVSSIEPVGEGALKRAYELLVTKLREEGLFARKRELPSFIRHIGVISSKNGVVIQDLMKNLAPLGIRVDFLHSGVEGADSARELLSAIRHFSRTTARPDVLVLIRGGGSLESLQGFNNEAVVRALYASPMPVLVGIGHDVDAPIATMVADWSASTPTAVAHVINDSWAPLTTALPLAVQRVERGMSELVAHHLRRRQLCERSLASAVRAVLARAQRVEEDMRRHVQTGRMWSARLMVKCTERASRLVRSYGAAVLRHEQRVGDLLRLINASDPERLLAQGYAIVRGGEGHVLRSVHEVHAGSALSVRLADGTVEGTVSRVVGST